MGEGKVLYSPRKRFCIMKRVILTIVAAVLCLSAFAAEVIVVDSEKVFKSIVEYNLAIERIDTLSKQYQAEVDGRFAQVSSAFEEYAATKQNYTATQRKELEAAILKMESEATALQESYFAQDGILIKLRLSLIAPIQERVFGVIGDYAEAKGADLVVDRAANPSVIFVRESIDCTAQIIELLKRK